MIRLTNLADYGVVLMCHMTRAPKDLYNAVCLSKETGIPVPTVSKIMGALSKADLLTSHRGLKGGFRMKRAAEDISVANIIEAVDGPIALTNCIEHTPGDCCYESLCSMKPHWQVINTVIRKGLDGITLDEIANPALALANLDPLVFGHSPKTGH
ncbi:MAG: SUF system Fe-S cluster assembly regulator [Sphingomonadales bacterium]